MSQSRFFETKNQPTLGYFENEFEAKGEISREALEAKIAKDKAIYEQCRNDRANLIYVKAPLGTCAPKEEAVRPTFGK